MEETVVAKWDYTATEGATQELSMTRNEVLYLLDDTKTWWKVRNRSGRVGYVPSNYVQPNKSKSSKKFFKTKSLDKNKGLSVQSAPSEETPDPIPTPNMHNAFENCTKLDEAGGGGGGFETFVIAKFTYEKSRPDELDLIKGQKIIVLEESEDDWWRGRDAESKQEGWFPSNYVEKVKTEKFSHDHGEEKSILAAYNENSKALENAKCLYDFKGGNAEELDVGAEEKLEILAKPETDPEWWVARTKDGRIGLVPRIYTERDDEKQTKKESSYGEISSRKWFFEDCGTRDVAENWLNEGHVEVGDYLVRPSESARDTNTFSVSVKGKNKNKHFRVKFDEQTSEYQIGQRKFKTLDILVENYTKNPIFSVPEERLYLVRNIVAY